MDGACGAYLGGNGKSVGIRSIHTIKAIHGIGFELRTEIIGPGVEIFNRVVVDTFPQMELGAYKLGKLVNEQFENLSLTKLPILYDEVGMLEKIQGTPRPMLLKGQNV